MQISDGPIRVIRTQANYDAALAEYESYFDAEPEVGSPAGDRFEILGLLLAKYEEEHFPIGADPVAVVQAVMEAKGYRQADLGRVLGSAPRASEIMRRKRDLSVEHIRRLNREWRIPAEALLGA
ncbi:MAG: helix-turn-helix domain-containing protein [Caulobacteraceae bacterium]